MKSRHICNGCDCEPEARMMTREELLSEADACDHIAELYPDLAVRYRATAQWHREAAAEMAAEEDT